MVWHRSADYYLRPALAGHLVRRRRGLLMNQAIHTVDLLQWLMGDVTAVSGHAATRFLGDTIEVEDTAEFVAQHTGGARSVFYATLAHAVNAPVTIEVVTEKAALSLRGDLTVSYARRPHRGRSPNGRRRPAAAPTGVSPTRSSSATSTRDSTTTSRSGSAPARPRSRSGSCRTSTVSPTRSRRPTERPKLPVTGSILPPARSTSSPPGASLVPRPTQTKPSPATSIRRLREEPTTI